MLYRNYTICYYPIHPRTLITKGNALREDLELDISPKEWVGIKAHTQTINSRLRLLQYKWLIRTYTTPVNLNKYDCNIPDLCVKCYDIKGMFFHCMAMSQCTLFLVGG